MAAALPRDPLSRALRILYATHGYKPAYRLGGPVVSVAAVAERLAARGHEVIVFATNSNLDEDLDVPLDRPLDVDGVQVWYFRRRTFASRRPGLPSAVSRSLGYLYAPRMAGELERLAPAVDLVHTHLPFIYPTYAAARFARSHRRPLFYHQRGVLDPARLKFRAWKKKLYLRAVERPILIRAATLFALTEAEVASYRALGVQTPCRVVGNGVDAAEFRAEPRPGFRQRWGIPEASPLILYLGRLHPIKGVVTLLEAFLRFRAFAPSATLCLAGPDEWGLAREIRLRAEGVGAGASVLLPGMLVGEEKRDWLARADLLCLPSEAEGFAIALLEALASETPVVASPGCHFPEVERAGAGRIVAAEASRLAEAFGELLADRARLSEMGRRGRELVLRDYTWDAVADRTLEGYREGLARAGERP